MMAGSRLEAGNEARPGTGRGAWAVAAAVIAVIFLLAAAPPPARAAQGPGVARISLVAGSVSVLRQGQGQWTKAVLNTPLVQGDEVYIAGGGRAEIEFDYADTIRLASGADVKLTEFDQGKLQLQLKGGTASYTAVGPSFLSNEIDTPNMSVRLIHAGTVRIDVVDASHTSATVWDGTAQVFTPSGSVNVDAGQQIQVAGSTNPQFRVVAAPAEDAWDHWVNQREKRVLEASDYNDHYLSEQEEGGADLDTYGQWVQVPGYGRCWRPWGEAVGWSPYYYGQWEWMPFYGWTWVSYEPWGWAPYHYGRWFWEASIGWCWWPGAFWGPHFWAPAYVSFFFGGPAWCRHYGFGFGAIGWIPLGPHEHYYGYSRINYISHVRNVTNIYNVRNVRVINGVRTVNGMPVRGLQQLGRLRNAHAPGGVVAISQRGFGHGRVDQMGRTLGYGALRGVSLVRGTAPVAPTRASLGFGARGVAPPRAMNSVRVFSHRPVRAMRSSPESLASVDRAMVAARSRAGFVGAPRGVRAQGRLGGRAAGGPSRIAAAAAASRARMAADARTGADRSFRIFGSPGVARGGTAARGGRTLRNTGAEEALARNGGWRSFGAESGTAAAYTRGAFTRQSGREGAQARFENAPMSGAARGGSGRATGNSGRFRGFENHPMQAAPAPNGRSYGGRSYANGAYSRNAGRSGGFENHPMATIPRSSYGGYSGQRAPADRGGAYRAPAYRAPAYHAPAYHAPAYHAPSFHASAPRGGGWGGGGGRRH